MHTCTTPFMSQAKNFFQQMDYQSSINACDHLLANTSDKRSPLYQEALQLKAVAECLKSPLVAQPTASNLKNLITFYKVAQNQLNTFSPVSALATLKLMKCYENICPEEFPPQSQYMRNVTHWICLLESANVDTENLKQNIQETPGTLHVIYHLGQRLAPLRRD